MPFVTLVLLIHGVLLIFTTDAVGGVMVRSPIATIKANKINDRIREHFLFEGIIIKDGKWIKAKINYAPTNDQKIRLFEGGGFVWSDKGREAVTVQAIEREWLLLEDMPAVTYGYRAVFPDGREEKLLWNVANLDQVELVGNEYYEANLIKYSGTGNRHYYGDLSRTSGQWIIPQYIDKYNMLRLESDSIFQYLSQFPINDDLNLMVKVKSFDKDIHIHISDMSNDLSVNPPSLRTSEFSLQQCCTIIQRDPSSNANDIVYLLLGLKDTNYDADASFEELIYSLLTPLKRIEIIDFKQQ